MAINYKFPGVYAQINDLSGIINTAAVTTCAFVGEAEYGPVLKPTLLSGLAGYTNKFGALSSRYGYAGYSLAVASDTIDSHYFVRVVPVGDPSASEEQRINDATWAAGTVLVKDSVAEQPISEGYWYEEITAAQESRDAGFASGLFAKTDKDSAFIVTAIDPNNRKFYVSISDSTINDNKAGAVVAPTTFEASSGSAADEIAAQTIVTVSIPASIVDGLEEGGYIVVSKMTNQALNGVFKVYDWVIDEQVAKVSYIVPGIQTETNDSNARIGKYPDENQTTFTLKVYEKVGRVMQQLEQFEYCTLYQSKDSYGNSMFVQDVVNGSSNYIQVFVNNNFTDENSDAVVIPADVEYLPLTGGQSGTWSDASAKMKDLCAAWDLFKDRVQYSVSILMNSGYVNKSEVSYQSKMLEVAEYRRDCFCLFDAPSTTVDSDSLIDWRKNTQGFTSYRGATFAPWVKTYDSVQGRAGFMMCPSAYIAKILGAYDPWIAPAGLNRGGLSNSTVSPTGLAAYYDDTTGGVLYTDNQINCLVRNSGAGYYNWGQRTCQAKPSSLDRINVARTIIYIETILRDAARWHVFENNTAYERNQITMQFNAFLDRILTAGGIQKYNVICDDTNNDALVIENHQLYVTIQIWPTFTAEVLILTTDLMSGVTSVS